MYVWAYQLYQKYSDTMKNITPFQNYCNWKFGVEYYELKE